MVFPSTSTGSSVSTLASPEFNFTLLPEEVIFTVSLSCVTVTETPLTIFTDSSGFVIIVSSDCVFEEVPEVIALPPLLDELLPDGVVVDGVVVVVVVDAVPGEVTTLASNVTAVCANALPFNTAPVFISIKV